jgi:hypothetical protein
MQRNDHPVLNDLLARIVHDEARHFSFYMWQAERRLADPRVARLVRAIMDRRYVPVGAAHHPDARARWVSGFLFDGEEGRLGFSLTEDHNRGNPQRPDRPAHPIPWRSAP